MGIAKELKEAERRALLKDLRRARRGGLSAGEVYRQLLRNLQQWALYARLTPAETGRRKQLARWAVLEVFGEGARVELDQLDLLPPDAGKVVSDG